jgi:competence ComEA-like helix-hairpin-helix protein
VNFFRRAALFLCFISLALLTSTCVKRARNRISSTDHDQKASLPTTSSQPAGQQTSAPDRSAAKPININTASANELETLPGIGEALAARIIEHRQKYGPFRKPEHLIAIRGISDKRFRALRDFITVD